MTEIGRISVVMYVSEQFVHGKLQLTLNQGGCLCLYFGLFHYYFAAYSVNASFSSRFIRQVAPLDFGIFLFEYCPNFLCIFHSCISAYFNSVYVAYSVNASFSSLFIRQGRHWVLSVFIRAVELTR